MSIENTLEIKMLGRFSIQYAGSEIVIDRNILSKTTQLLQLLTLNSAEGIPKTTLIDALYGREEVENKNGSLNNTIFRMRKQLRAAGFPESTYVSIQGGMCYWDTTQVPVKIDAVEFAAWVSQGRLEEEPDKQIECFEKAIRLYTGEFLPTMIGEDWVSIKNVQYRDMYIYCMGELCHIYTEMEKYEEVIRIAHEAAEIYPTDDWQLWEIDSYIAVGRYKDAMEVYEHMTKVMMDELGLSPTPEMLKRFHLMGERMAQAAGAIEDIKLRLDEKEHMMGAYFCTYPSFVDIYHVFSRIMERKGISVYIMLCTLKDYKNQTCGEKEGKERNVSFILQDSIRMALRRGDFYTRYNYSQYLIMLSEIKKENCKVVSDRIKKVFHSNNSQGNYHVDFYVASIAEVCSEAAKTAETAERKFRNSDSVWKKNK